MRRGRSRNESRSVAIVGAGLGGIAAAVALKKQGFDRFVIYEKASGPGGVWWANTYPGCEVDIASHAYSFSFHKHNWVRTHATQPELQAYAEQVIDRFGLRPHLRLDSHVSRAEWDPASSSYQLTVNGEAEQCDFLVSAVGLLNVPNYPSWPGLDDFGGAKFHTSEWDHDVPLEGKRVAVVGTGSTASQLVPQLAEVAESLFVFQREPGWVLPKNEREFTPRERLLYDRVPGAQKARRLWLTYQGMKRFRAYAGDNPVQEAIRSAALQHIETTIPEDALREQITPDYPFGCKRPIFASTFYAALTRPNVHLVPHSVTEVTSTGVVDSQGAHYDIDVLVLSTGFQPTSFLKHLQVVGRYGEELHEYWGDRPRALFGLTVPGFPNFFLLYGPNTNGGVSVTSYLERQATLAAKAIALSHRRGWRAIDTRPDLLPIYLAWLDHQIETRIAVQSSGCHNYYRTAAGVNVTQWPRSFVAYYLATALVSPRSWFAVPEVGPAP